MIEFKGELTENTLNFYKKRMVRSRQGTNIFFLVFGLPMLTFFLHFVMPLKYIFFIVVPVLAVAAVVLPYLVIKVSKDRLVPKCITINDGVISLIINSGSTDSRKIEQVKAVKDYGEYYTLTFKGFFTVSSFYICQKDLLTQGSIEEFETLFADKLKKMN